MTSESRHELRLDACRVMPLAGYLKGLAILRLVSEQVDATARGLWADDAFVLRSSLDTESLLDFFVDAYRPTPVVAPWNGGSGFYPGDNDEALQKILHSETPLFNTYADVIKSIKSWPEMPAALETVGEIVTMLTKAVEMARPGKKKDDWVALLQAEENSRSLVEASIAEQAGGDTSLAEIESRCKEGGPSKNSWTQWRNAVKKLRTTCTRNSRGNDKETILRICRARLPEECLSWLDAAYALLGEGRTDFNPILGTGGNEGRLDFSTNFMQRLVELLGPERDRDTARRLVSASLFGTATQGLPKAKIGQFDPGRAGGYNQGAEFETKDFKANPWDFILTMEGTTSLGSAVHKRLGGTGHGQLASPFTVRFSGAGFASAAEAEGGRAETWLPVWSRPARYREIEQLFREGRAMVSGRNARTGLDFARAVRTLGVARGVDEFVRFAFLERRGKSYVALPAGRMHVRFAANVRLLDDLDPVLDGLDRGMARLGNQRPASLSSARRRIDMALFACTESPSSERMLDLVMSLGDMDRLLAVRAASGAKESVAPMRGLSLAWLEACDDGSPEVRIAAALASIGRSHQGMVGPLRSNFAGVDPEKPWRWATGRGQRRWRGISFVERLGGALEQRLMDAARGGLLEAPIRARIGLSAYDTVPFLFGATDDDRIEHLMWGFGLIRWDPADSRREVPAILQRWRHPLSTVPIPRSFALLKLLHWPGEIRGNLLRREPRIASLLQAGRISEALEIASRRLRTSGLPPLPVSEAGDLEPVRLLAALLIPLRGARILEELVLSDTNTTRVDRDPAWVQETPLPAYHPDSTN